MFKKSPEQRIMKEADRIVSLKEDFDVVSWGRVSEIAKKLQAEHTEEQVQEWARELLSIARSNTWVLDKFGVGTEVMTGMVIPSGIEIQEGDQYLSESDGAASVAVGAQDAPPEQSPTSVEETRAPDAQPAISPTPASAVQDDTGKLPRIPEIAAPHPEPEIATDVIAALPRLDLFVPSTDVFETVTYEGDRTNHDTSPHQVEEMTEKTDEEPDGGVPVADEGIAPMVTQPHMPATEGERELSEAELELRSLEAQYERMLAANDKVSVLDDHALDPVEGALGIAGAETSRFHTADVSIGETIPDTAGGQMGEVDSTPERLMQATPPASADQVGEEVRAGAKDVVKGKRRKLFGKHHGAKHAAVPMQAPDPAEVSSDKPQPSDTFEQSSEAPDSAAQDFARFRHVYSGKKGNLCLYEDADGHLVAVDPSRFA